MTAVQRFADGIRTRRLEERQRISQASHRLVLLAEKRLFRAAIRLREQAEMLGDYIRQGESVLDVACGAGYLSKYLEEMYAAKPTGLDVTDFRAVPISFRSFDGTSIPFPERTFDHVVLSFVLHHSHDPMTLVQECRRVARRSIMIFEDLPETLFGRIRLFLHVSICALFYPFRPAGIADYRSALMWLNNKAVNVVRIAMPPERPTLYPRFLLVYRLSMTEAA
jgi:SAM-dependent methyltransferase